MSKSLYKYNNSPLTITTLRVSPIILSYLLSMIPVTITQYPLNNLNNLLHTQIYKYYAISQYTMLTCVVGPPNVGPRLAGN